MKPIFYLITGTMFVFFISFFLKNDVMNVSVNFLERPSSIVFSKLSGLRLYISELSDIKRITQENLKLRKENTQLLSQLSGLSKLKDENEFLRQALKLPETIPRKFIQGNVFNVDFISSSHNILLNKGKESGVSIGDIIISDEGVLVGEVNNVFSDYSKAVVITDPSFKTTVEVINSKITAIARGGLDKGLYLDFISQEDPVKEGDLVITSGNDLIPAGLIIGKVSFVKVDDNSLFKKVRVHPLMKDINLSKILIIKK